VKGTLGNRVLPGFSYAVLSLCQAFAIIGCNSGSSSPPPPNISISLVPKHAGVTTTQTQQFTATVTGSINTNVTWEVDAVPSGNFSVGTIDATGKYVAPATGGTHTVAARSQADGTKTASASIGVTDLAGVFTYHNDNSRTGGNLKEFALTPSNVNTATFGKLFSCTVDAAIYAQPLWVPNLMIGGASHNVVFVATERDTVYAFDGDANSCVTYWKTGANGVNSLIPLWRSFGNERRCGLR
jgi:hypothetical protein